MQLTALSKLLISTLIWWLGNVGVEVNAFVGLFPSSQLNHRRVSPHGAGVDWHPSQRKRSDSLQGSPLRLSVRIFPARNIPNYVSNLASQRRLFANTKQAPSHDSTGNVQAWLNMQESRKSSSYRMDEPVHGSGKQRSTSFYYLGKIPPGTFNGILAPKKQAPQADFNSLEIEQQNFVHPKGTHQYHFPKSFLEHQLAEPPLKPPSPNELAASQFWPECKPSDNWKCCNNQIFDSNKQFCLLGKLYNLDILHSLQYLIATEERQTSTASPLLNFKINSEKELRKGQAGPYYFPGIYSVRCRTGRWKIADALPYYACCGDTLFDTRHLVCDEPVEQPLFVSYHPANTVEMSIFPKSPVLMLNDDLKVANNSTKISKKSAAVIKGNRLALVRN